MPIDLTFFGITILDKLTHSLNESCPIGVAFSGMVNEIVVMKKERNQK